MTDRDRDVRERCAEIADEYAETEPHRFSKIAGREIERRIRALDLPLTSAREVTDGTSMALDQIKTARKDRWIEYCLQRGRTDIPSGPFDCQPYIRNIDAAIAALEAALASAPQPGEQTLKDRAEKIQNILARHISDQCECNGLGAASYEIARVFGGSAPQPACVGADDAKLVAELRAIIDEGDRYGTAAKNSTTIYTRQRIEAAAQRIETPPPPAPSPQAGEEKLPRDVVRLVIAARHVAFEDTTKEAIAELDKASEVFADRVPWEDEPQGGKNEAT